ncbi:hypothetical protein BZG36_04458 [Bifiguratus adelaidae]|uniref:Uricase n=1 Tax=Bifiguratus adelaidae TaxID=1938954 RepID=A0A261XVC9_9FUNG|nr:hypothetical protein BZG36_04458 [Bifiguratus adelaidae]
MPEQFVLKTAKYGKDKVRLLKVYRTPQKQVAVELTVRLMLEGDIETSYTKADNSVVVTTDTCKNTVYYIAKHSQNVDTPELFAQELTQHMLNHYSHIHVAHAEIIKHKWTRILVDGKPHAHSFVRDGDEVQTVHVTQYRKGDRVECKSGISNLLVLKTTGSAFYGYYKDQFTTLPEVWDRIFSTAVDCTWTYNKHSVAAFRNIDFQRVFDGVKKITLETFATDDSASVQATMYLIQTRILELFPEVEETYYSLPNKHYFGVDMSKLAGGIDNTGKNLDVYQPVSDPSGLITATVSRKPKSRL